MGKESGTTKPTKSNIINPVEIKKQAKKEFDDEKEKKKKEKEKEIQKELNDLKQETKSKDNVIQGKLAYISRNGQAEVAIKKVFLPQIMSTTTPMNLIRGGNVVSSPAGDVIRKGNCWSNPRVLICFKTR